jgi:ribosomal protein S12 methylthiotransferase accessory factor
MWTWVQRVSRERIAAAGLPAGLRERVAAVRARGLEVTFVDLTLETDPVILCAVHDEGSLTVGARCHPDPARAAEGAFSEAAVTRFGVRPRPVPEPARVRSPAEHEALYRGSPRAAAQAAFLHDGPATKELGDVRGAGEPVAQALAGIGELVGEPVLIDLTTPRSRPFHVARAVVPGLVPIAFGHDREPLGMPLLARPRRGADGSALGRELDLAAAGPLLPHPFA